MPSVTLASALNFAPLCLRRKVDGPRAPRDERRRAQHNEGEFRFLKIITSGNVLCAIFIFFFFFFAVERRRRDKINNWIVTLSKIIPDCSVDSRTGAVSAAKVVGDREGRGFKRFLDG